MVDDHAAGGADSGSEQPRQLGVDAGGSLVGVAGRAAKGGAESADGGECLLGLLGLGQVVAVAPDAERVVQAGGKGACAFGEAPEFVQEPVKTGEIGLRPLALARARERVSPARAPRALRADAARPGRREGRR